MKYEVVVARKHPFSYMKRKPWLKQDKIGMPGKYEVEIYLSRKTRAGVGEERKNK